MNQITNQEKDGLKQLNLGSDHGVPTRGPQDPVPTGHEEQRGLRIPPKTDEERKFDRHRKKCLGKLRDLDREYKVALKSKWRRNPRREDVGNKDVETQVGLMNILSCGGSLTRIAQLAGVDLPDWIINEVEDLLLVFVSLQGQTSPIGAIASVMQWVKRYFNKSMSGTIKEYLEELLIPTTAHASGIAETPEWLKAIRDVKTDWTLVRHNQAFGQLSKLLGLLVTLGLCKASNLEFRMNGFLLFAPRMQDKHASAFDLMDATFETILFFIEGMYLCFTTQSLKPLLVSDHAALQLDVEFATLMSEWELVKVGNLHKIKGKSDQEFQRRVDDLATNLKNLANTLTGFDKKLVLDKFQKILTLQNDFTTMKMGNGVRHAPFAMLFFGESSQGKTTAMDQITDALCVSRGLPSGKEFRATYNAGDKFMSNWTTDKVVLTFDDISNEKSTFVERAPTRAVLDVINNQMYYANKAELEAKGKCFVEPWIVMASTNKKDIDAHLYSNCPFSIQRRFITITVECKREFQKVVDGIYCGVDSKRVRNYNANHPEFLFDDIWEFTVEDAVKPAKLDIVAGYKPVEWKGKKLTKISMRTLINFLCESFNDHCENQEAILEGMRGRDTTLHKCPVEGCPHVKGICPDHPNETQFGKKIITSLTNLGFRAMEKRPDMRIVDKIEEKAADAMYHTGRKFIDKFEWIQAIPEDVAKYFIQDDTETWKNELFQLCYGDVLQTNYDRCVTTMFTMSLLSTLIGYGIGYGFGNVHYGHPGALIAVCCYYTYLTGLYARVEHDLRIELLEKNFRVSTLVKSVRDDTVKYICGTSVAVGALYVVAKMVRKHFEGVKSQGSLAPVTQREVDARDAEKNVWSSVVTRPLPISQVSKTVSSSVLQGLIDKNLVCCQIDVGSDIPGQMDCLFIKSNVVLVPFHYFDKFGPTLNASMYKSDPMSCGGKFAVRLELATAERVGSNDMMMCYCPNGGSFRDLTKHFPLEKLASHVNFRLTYRFADGKLGYEQGVAKPALVEVENRYFYEGLEYEQFSTNTFPGLCGAVLHSETNGSIIAGFHLAGRAGTPFGYAGTLTQGEIKVALKALRSKEGVLLTGTAENFETQVLGKTVVDPNAKPHPKSPLNFLPHESQVEYYGSCPGRSTTKSDVKVTPISEHIADVCNEPNIYGPPKMQPEWFGYQACLSNLSNPALPYEYELLHEAVIDYKGDLMGLFEDELWNDTRPLTDVENCSGIPGTRFVDAIKLNTAIGPPMSGNKDKYVYIATTIEELKEYYDTIGGTMPEDEIKRLTPTKNGAQSYQVVKFIPEISEEIVRIENCYKRGERGYTLAKACKKDEILAKEKCRIFYANAIALTYLIRKYYLPLLRVMQMNPLVSECAVGINSHGPEWDEFDKHATRFGMDRLIGGDYGKYDQKLPAQLIIASLRILIDCAAVCRYTSEDLRVMEAMVGDIVYAVIAFNGDLIGLTEGTHISGNSLTVIINGICGSLNLRCYFYSDPRHKGLSFREWIALMTYGDDNIGSVRKGCDNFTIKGASEFLAKYGQVYTMPDKESELVDFLPPEEFEFLKRKSVYHPQLGCTVGALVDKSCFKMLHCFMRSKGSPDTEDVAAAKNIDTALGEWFNHGEEMYETRRSQMQEVAKRAGISHFCRTLDKSYATKVDEWKANYGS